MLSCPYSLCARTDELCSDLETLLHQCCWSPSLVLCPQAIDLAFLQYTVAKTLQRSASVHLLFAFEYVIQASIVASTAIKYGLGVVDNLMEGRWESKVRRSRVV